MLLPLDLIKVRRILQQPRALNLRHIPNERLVPSLHDFVEDDPVSLAILAVKSDRHTFINRREKGNLQTSTSSDARAASSRHSQS